MKKYITPNIECSSCVGAMLLYTPSDGKGEGAKEGPGSPDSGAPTF